MTIEEFKEKTHNLMLEFYKIDEGHLNPMLAVLKDGQATIMEIDPRFMVDPEAKMKLADVIKKLCKMPTVFAISIIGEAFITSLDGNPHKDDLLSGKKRIRDIKQKKSIILMSLSTPETDELIGYYVNPKTKKIGKKLETNEKTESGLSNLQGIFSGFFDWNRN